MDMWNLFVAVILGIVEGLTEFAPVSSTGHMIAVDDLWLKSNQLFGSEVANTFKVVIQLGSILAVVVVFRQRFFDMLGIKTKHSPSDSHGGSKLSLLTVIIGILPAGILGFAFADFIDEKLFSVQTVVIGLIGGALLMIAADLLQPKVKTETVDKMTYRQAFMMGLFQCIGLWPGFSRSGSTISGGVLLGISHRAASDFTFIMAVPVMAGASGISLLKHWDYITSSSMPFFIVGFITAFIFALISIRFFLKMINRVKLIPFAIYRIVIAIIILLMIM
ncbi:undecaprenyl-diphosphate phosphatase [Bacillus sp. FJAT-42376]|uniref:undecaprenyl-diphosphate phosphatase n=1 Tax=Bacillus sp. FJAT-42376 TaxID=2014076 RepID=UPI000F4F31E3|nr:undecaprenyl-diphosphate phosphatase [Bacillus sp. FJAT-42376]AZB44167.1 undecaprenyl-diphosphate phosphatase [Bacillus sp. FJAT-42376]